MCKSIVWRLFVGSESFSAFWRKKWMRRCVSWRRDIRVRRTWQSEEKPKRQKLKSTARVGRQMRFFLWPCPLKTPALQHWSTKTFMFCLRFFEWTTEALRSSSAPPNSGRRPEKRSAIDVECAFMGLKDFLFMASYFCSFTKEMMSLLSMAHMAPGTVLLAVCCWLRFDHKDCSRPPGKIQCTVLVSGLLWFTLRFPCNISGCTKLPSCL